MAYTKKTTHVSEAIRNLIDVFEDKPKVVGLLTSFVNRVQDLENTFSDILTETALGNASGAQLDLLGAIVGEERNGRSDLQYATAINAQIRLLRSEGTIEDVIDLITAIVGELQVDIVEYYPAKFAATIDEAIDPDEVDVGAMGALIASGKPAGVGMSLIYFTSPNPFRFDTAGQGFDQGEFPEQEDF
jgi:hypothetical protein